MKSDNVTRLEQKTMGQQLAPLTTRDILTDDALFNRIHKLAELMASGTITTARHLRGNVADCFAITMQATRWGMDPFVVSDKTFVIEGTGKIGYESQLVNAVAQTMSPIVDRFHYDYFGDWDKVTGKYEQKTSQKGHKYHVPAWSKQDEEGVGVVISATLRGEAEPRTLRLLLAQAAVRNSVQWAYDPQQQLGYLAVKKWVRRVCPDALMGVYTPDEVEPASEVYMGAATTAVDDGGEPDKVLEGELMPKTTDAPRSKSDETLAAIRQGKAEKEAQAKKAEAADNLPGAAALIRLFDTAESLEDCEAIKGRAGHLSGSSRTRVIAAYRKCRDKFKAAAEAAEATSNDLSDFDDDGEEEGMTLSIIADKFHDAKDQKQLEKLRSLIEKHLTNAKEIELAQEEFEAAGRALDDKAAAAAASEG